MVRLIWVLSGHTSAHMYKHGWKFKIPELSKFKSLNMLYAYKVLSISHLNWSIAQNWMENKSEDIKICLIHFFEADFLW